MITSVNRLSAVRGQIRIVTMIYQFDNIAIDTDAYQVTRDGNAVALERRAFDLLLYLIEQRERVVTRDELLERLWPGRIVTDSALTGQLKAARKAIGDDGKTQGLIKTVHGRGYQFISTVETTGQPRQTNQTSIGEPPALPDKPSIAVLPFVLLGDDPDQAHLADGMTQEILNRLSRLPNLFVIAFSSTLDYKGRGVDVREVGREQGVGHVLEGSLRRSGDRIRVTSQLIDTQTLEHLWSQTYQRELTEIFDLQDEIAQQVVIELQGQLVTGESIRLFRSITDNVKAWELVTRADTLLQGHIRDNTLRGRQLILQALELDESYAEAWTHLGWTYWQDSYWQWSNDPQATLEQAYDAAQKGLQDPKNAYAHSLLGYVHFSRKEYLAAATMCRRAAEIAPGDAQILALLGSLLVDTGEFAEGIQTLQRAVRLCPMTPAWYLSMLGGGLHLSGDNASAVPILRKAIAREPESILAYLYLASAMVETGQLAEARQIAESVRRLEPGFTLSMWLDGNDKDVYQQFYQNLLQTGLSA